MRSRTFRSLFGAFAGAFLIGGALVPSADAVLVAYFNFEDTTLGTQFNTATSQPPGPTGIVLTVTTTPPTPSPTSTQGVAANVAPGDLAPNLHGAGFVTTTGGTATLKFTVNTMGLTNLSLSFAVNNNGNGFNLATFSYQVDAGPTMFAGTQPIPNGAKNIVTFDFSPFTAVNNQTSVTFSVVLSGGTSMGSNLQTIVDNIQLNAVPEPATVAGGLLGVLGLCWFQRRRLIRSVRLRRP
jgi:hypothetical protein